MAREAALLVDSVVHRYGNVCALENVSLEILDGDLVTLLGPSGCGKTTLLRIVAGFLRPEQGRILLHGRDVTRSSPHKRPVNMVFQRPTLFPHLDVFENVAFGLRVSRVESREIANRVADALALVRMEEYSKRRADELSGGQMQRVALARALVKRPQLLLLDEPLSALDLKIRLELEADLRRVHRETAATFVYVTHDQREALALSDRVVVFDHGHIEQVGTPTEIYRRPASPFAARFVGDSNVIPAEVAGHSGQDAVVRIGDNSLSVYANGMERGACWLVIRPESILLTQASSARSTALRGIVRDVAFRGVCFTYRVEVAGLADVVRVETAAEAGPPFTIGSEVDVAWESTACTLLPRVAQ
jgi:ABC-type Fe3+/spermidine/putrescine transport system ATPase subunit